MKLCASPSLFPGLRLCEIMAGACGVGDLIGEHPRLAGDQARRAPRLGRVHRRLADNPSRAQGATA